MFSAFTSLDCAIKMCVVLTISTVFYFSRDNLTSRRMGGLPLFYRQIPVVTRIRLVYIIILLLSDAKVSTRNGESHGSRGSTRPSAKISRIKKFTQFVISRRKPRATRVIWRANESAAYCDRFDVVLYCRTVNEFGKNGKLKRKTFTCAIDSIIIL